jgi:hypothetical protein
LAFCTVELNRSRVSADKRISEKYPNRRALVAIQRMLCRWAEGIIDLAEKTN